MAKIYEETVTIRMSRLVKETENAAQSMVTDDVLTALEQVTQELIGPSVIVEVEQNHGADYDR